MGLPVTVEEFIAQSEAAKLQDNYREFLRFGIGYAEVDQVTGEIKEVVYIQVNDQNSGAGGTYSHIWIHVGEQLSEQGYVIPTDSQAKDLQNTFNPFRNDGKAHPNIDALDSWNDLADSRKGYTRKPFVCVVFQEDNIEGVGKSSLMSASYKA